MAKVSIMFFLSLFFSCIVPGISQAKKDRKPVNWLTVQQVENLMRKETRPVIVDVYTGWCAYCKLMDATTWKNDSVRQYIAQHFYAIKLDAESKAPISWQGTEYLYKEKYKVHDWAIKLLRGSIVYPSLVIIPEKGAWQVLPGAFTATELEAALKYYGSKANERIDFETYHRQFSGSWGN